MSKKFMPLLVFAGTTLLSIGIIRVTNFNNRLHAIDEAYIDENGYITEPMDIATHTEDKAPEAKYEESVVLVKGSFDSDKDKVDLDILNIEELYPNSEWKKITLKETSSFDAVQYLRKTNLFDKVDYNYVMEADGTEIEGMISNNTLLPQQYYLDQMNIRNAWEFERVNDLTVGGSPDVVIAVIDTGVDYNHIDLRNNIWTNVAEIPNNGLDDDGNGYIDDVHGWDCVNEDNDPMDDNGHGTHVAGIAAAENNNVGTVGVAFNCKIMPIKAGNHSGSFTNADIAQAVQYACLNGATVINMSFGGQSISSSVYEELQNSYNQCVLVAAAGNSQMCIDLDCEKHINSGAFFPAALSFVVGVMSCNSNCSTRSSFTNFDHSPYRDNEYEIYACGEQIPSTWPNNKFVTMNGTSMAAPIVSGIAALLRSQFTDKDTYSTKYINSQICNTSSRRIDTYHSVLDGYKALSFEPVPNIYKLNNYYIFDTLDLSQKNNNDSVINAGETIKLGIELQNRGGKASNVTITMDTYASGDPNLPDPHIELIESEMHMDEIGTYSIQDGGKIYDGNKVVGMNNAFKIKISDNCPNDYLSTLNFHLTYSNGLNSNDHTIYYSDFSLDIVVSNGQLISGIIDTDTVFNNSRMYYITSNVIIPEGVTVIFTAGCNIQFYAPSFGYIYNDIYDISVTVHGKLYLNGEENNLINIYRDSMVSYQKTFGFTKGSGEEARIEYSYCHSINGRLGGDIADHCIGDKISTKIVTNSIMTSGPKDSGVTQVSDSLLYGTFHVEVSNATNNLYIADGTTYCEYEFGYGVNTNNSFIIRNIPTSINNIPHVSLYNGISGSNSTGTVFDPIVLEHELDVAPTNINSQGQRIVNLNDEANHDDSLIWPYVTDVSIYNNNDDVVKEVGSGTHTVKVTFSRPMDTNSNFKLFYGSTEPYSDYEVPGDFISSTVWEGEIDVKSYIEGGIQYFKFAGGYAEGDPWRTIFDTGRYFTFSINTSSAQSMSLQANATDNGVELTWLQDDYDTLMGYNIYRSTSLNGNYTKINSMVIPSNENTFIDDSCQPGQTYWYTFTVVFTDFTESAPAGKVSCQAVDTVAPTIYHTPVNQAYANNNLVISCQASDNIGVQSGILYYRTIGAENWKTLTMTKVNSRLTATIFGSEVTIDGLEYYISVTDGRNAVTRGSADNPYTIVVKDASLLNNVGDVDGDGVITTKDALMIVRAINGQIILTDDQFQRADLNKDGVLSSAEALKILQYVNGKISTLDM